VTLTGAGGEDLLVVIEFRSSDGREVSNSESETMSLSLGEKVGIVKRSALGSKHKVVSISADRLSSGSPLDIDLVFTLLTKMFVGGRFPLLLLTSDGGRCSIVCGVDLGQSAIVCMLW